jgi:hypothetical protein
MSIAIPPILIPIVPSETYTHPVPPVTVKKQEQKVYNKNYIQYDFPSPACMYSTCDTCNISFEFANTRDNETCVSCETIQNNHRWYKTPLPTCSICETECYYIHRECGRPICKHCKYNFQVCPYCKYPV